MQVTLVTEGTYPNHHGGVSVWCDQMLRGMPDVYWHLYAITDAAGRVPVWDIPDNVIGVTTVPIWEPARRARVRTPWEQFPSVALELVEAIFDHPDDGPDRFIAALRDVAAFAEIAPLTEAIRSTMFLDLLTSVWDGTSIQGRQGDVPDRTLLDVLTARDYLERFLRPLAVPPPRSDIIHASANGLGALVGMMGKWRSGIPFMLTEHGVYLRERYLSKSESHSWHVDTFMLRFFRHLTAAGYATADLITPGNRYNRRWEVQSGIPNLDIRTVYNGVDPEEFPEIVVEPEVPTVSWAGRVDPLKDLETLIRAFALVRDEIPEARLRLFGGTPPGNEAYRERCERLIDALGLTDATTFEGRVDDIADAYRAGHVVALTSISEGFPYTLIEAMISGSAMVATDVGGVSEAIADAGLMAPARDHQALARNMVDLLVDDELRWDIRRRARRRALDLFTLEQCLTTFRGIYAELGARWHEPQSPPEQVDSRPSVEAGSEIRIDLREDPSIEDTQRGTGTR